MKAGDWLRRDQPGGPDPRILRPVAPPRGPGPWTELLRSLGEQFLVAGPILGLLGALYRFHLANTAPRTPDPALHALIRETRSFHGHFIHAYYITPQQNLLWWALTGPALAWLVIMVLTLAGLGMRAHRRRR
jgi:hypothetical protein